MTTAADRWRTRQIRRMSRDAERLLGAVTGFARGVHGKGPYADEARDLARAALDLARLAASVDGMQEVTDLMTEEA